MRIRSILYIVLVLFVLGVLFYSNSNFEKLSEDLVSNSIKKSTLQLSPLPVIVSQGTGHQNTILYDLMINKSDEIVLLYDSEVDLGGFAKLFPFDTKHLTVEFKYNKSKERLEFSGSNLQGRRVHGFCLLTNKNNIKYHIVFEGEGQKLQIDYSVNNPDQENSDESAGGTFIFESSNKNGFYKMLGAKFPINTNSFSLRGNFISKTNNLSLSNISVQDNLIGMSVIIDYKNDLNAIPSIKVTSASPEINLDDMVKSFDGNILDLVLLNDLLVKMNKFTIEASISADSILYNGIVLKNASLAIDNKNNGEMKVSDLHFSLSKDANVKMNGSILTHQSHPQYEGYVSVENVKYSDLAKILSFKESNKNDVVSFYSNITINPSLLIFRKLKLKEGAVALKSDFFRYSSFDDSNIISGKVHVNGALNHSKLVTEIINKYSEFTKDKKNKDIIDIDLELSDKSEAVKAKNISLNYESNTSSMRLSNISFPNYNLEGSVDIDSDKSSFNGRFVGHDIELTYFNALISDLMKIKSLNPRLNKVSGIVNFDIKNTKNKEFKGLNCSIEYRDEKAQFNNCAARLFDTNFTFSGKVIESQNKIHYDLSYNAENIQLSKVLSNGKSTNISEPRGVFDLQGYLKSNGKSDSDLSNNLVGVSVIKFDNAFISMNPSAENSNQKKKIFNLVSANLDLNKGVVRSENVECVNESKETSNLSLVYNSQNKAIEIAQISDKK